MEISRLTAEQQVALLDLLILAMYADGRLDLEEDARLNRLLTTMGISTEYDRDRVLDDSITRLREYSKTRKPPARTPFNWRNISPIPSNAAAFINCSSNRRIAITVSRRTNRSSFRLSAKRFTFDLQSRSFNFSLVKGRCRRNAIAISFYFPFELPEYSLRIHERY